MEGGGAVSIVAPTLREAANQRPLAERVAGALAGSSGNSLTTCATSAGCTRTS